MIYENWSRALGLAATPLFGPNATRAHTALLDGVTGSFVLSDAGHAEFDGALAPSAPNWSWSSMMRHHVLVTDETVTVTPSAGGDVEVISRGAVDASLERFLGHLEGRRAASVTDVVDHVIATFQGLRARLGGSDETQLSTFLALVALRLSNRDVVPRDMPDLLADLAQVCGDFGIDPDVATRTPVGRDLARSFFEELLRDRRTNRSLHIDLTIRHAGAELFQAAHLAPPVLPAQGEFWGMTAPGIRIRPHSLKDVAYTPIGLARFVAEQTLIGCRPGSDGRLTILDPTCGSGSFLVEALAALQRAGWKLPVRVLGYDISPAAVTTARFALACAIRDGLDFAVTSDIRRLDFLDPDETVEAADVVLMNPPFRAWPALSAQAQAEVRQALGENYSGRPDQSMAFVQRAVDTSGENAVVAALLPVGVLSAESADKWRPAIANEASPRLIGALGDHTLFRFATVNVCAVILDKAVAAQDEQRIEPPEVQMLWASEKPGAASAALRTLRRQAQGGLLVTAVGGEKDNSAWSLYPLPLPELELKPNWLPAPGLLSEEEREALAALETRVSDLFDVHTGIRAGERKAFILSGAELAKLPLEERRAFKPVAEKRQISQGAITATDYIFSAGEEIETEEELQSSYPSYYRDHLQPARATLRSRVRSGSRWWRQSEPRNKWRLRTEPRLVSRQWIKTDGFAVDATGAYAVVQGYAWFPNTRLKRIVREVPDAGDMVEVLRLYAVMMSSDVFFKVAREYSTNAGGGQIALQQKHLKHVPLPIISEVVSRKAHLLDMIVSWGESFPDLVDRNKFAAICYGFPAEE